MSNIQFEVKVYRRFDNNLITAYTLSDERYDIIDEDKAMILAKNAVEWTISEECRFTIKRK